MPVFISRFRLSALLYFLIAPIVLGAQSGQGIASVPGSVVVVPFANLTGDPAEDWIGVGIAEAVTAEIESRIDLSITVISIDSPNRNGGNGLDEQILLAARGRAATHVLTGTYQRSDSRVRIIARLVEVANEEVSGVVTVDGSLADLFVLQDRVAIEIEQVIESVHLGPNSSVSMSREPAMADGQRERADSQRGTVSAAPPSGPIDLTGLIDGPPAPIPPAVMRRDEQGRTTVRAIKVDEGIRLDGVLDEAVYSSIPAISDFIQQVPQAGAPATERTEAWILFDEVNIYVSARVWDSAPESEWIANEMREIRVNFVKMIRLQSSLTRFTIVEMGSIFIPIHSVLVLTSNLPTREIQMVIGIRCGTYARVDSMVAGLWKWRFPSRHSAIVPEHHKYGEFNYVERFDERTSGFI